MAEMGRSIAGQWSEWCEMAAPAPSTRCQSAWAAMRSRAGAARAADRRQQPGAGLGVEDVERRAEGVGVDAVRRDDADGAAAGDRPAGAQIDDVRAADAVDGHPLLGVAGRRDRGAHERDAEGIAAGPGRRSLGGGGERGDRHRPGRLPGRRIPGGDVAANRDQRGAGAVRAQDAQRLLGGVALGDAAGVDLDPGLGERDGAAPRIEPHLGEAAGGAGGRDAIRLGPGVQAAGPPPQVREAAGGDVEGAAGAPRQRIRGREHGEQILADRHGDAGGGARQRRHLAVVAVVAEAGVDRGDARERRLRRRLAGRRRVGVEHDADERAHVGRARLDAERRRPAPVASTLAGPRPAPARARQSPRSRPLTPSRLASAPAASASAPTRASSASGSASPAPVPTSRRRPGRRPRGRGSPASELSAICFSSLSGLPARRLSIMSRVLGDVGVVDLALERPRLRPGDVELRQDEGAAGRADHLVGRPSCRCCPAAA